MEGNEYSLAIQKIGREYKVVANPTSGMNTLRKNYGAWDDFDADFKSSVGESKLKKLYEVVERTSYGVHAFEDERRVFTEALLKELGFA